MEWQNWEFLQSPFPISLPFPSLQLLLDASSQGWGGDFISRQGLRDLAFGVPGLVHEPARLMTIFHSLEHFCSTLQGNPVLVMSENSTAVACFRNQGIQRSVSLLNCQVASGSGSDRFPCLPVCPAVFKRYFFFLPFSLFHKVIARLSSFKGKGILFVPSFPEAPGFPYLLRRPKGHPSLPSSMTLSQVTSRLYGLLRGSNIPNWEALMLLVCDYLDF